MLRTLLLTLDTHVRTTCKCDDDVALNLYRLVFIVHIIIIEIQEEIFKNILRGQDFN